jgi:hypothetical protein
MPLVSFAVTIGFMDGAASNNGVAAIPIGDV